MEGEQETMTLDDAIAYYDEVAKECRRKANIERNDYMDLKDNALEAEQLADWLNELKLFRDRFQTMDAVEVVRCRDCKHRPTGENRDDLEFPDELCPCQCEDFWYNWKPSDNWFCANGERKDGEAHGSK